MTEETITLREAARRLARIRRPKGNGIESGRLLNLLRSGELKAGFYFSHGTVWIEIPSAYWQGIDGNKFRRIAHNASDPKSGTYKLKANEFPDQVANVICNRIEQNEKDSGQQQIKPFQQVVADVVDASATSHEVLIKATDFNDYLDHHGLKEKTSASNVGRWQKEGWRDICSYTAAYLVAHYRDLPGVELKVDESSKVIIKLAEEDGVEKLVSSYSLKEQVSKALGLIESPKAPLSPN